MSGNIKIAGREEKHISDRRVERQIPAEIRQQILSAIAHLEYGSVEVVVHDGGVVQIESREKIRVGRNQFAGE